MHDQEGASHIWCTMQRKENNLTWQNSSVKRGELLMGEQAEVAARGFDRLVVGHLGPHADRDTSFTIEVDAADAQAVNRELLRIGGRQAADLG